MRRLSSLRMLPTRPLSMRLLSMRVLSNRPLSDRMRSTHPFALSMLLVAVLLVPAALQARPLTVAAASDLRQAMDALVVAFRAERPDIAVQPIYGSSGKFSAQIENGAPFDLYFSADEAYPERLHALGHAASPPRRYGLGRLVLWEPGADGPPPTLAALAEARYRRIAIANPAHAPYGVRAVEALQAAGLHARVERRLVFGENVSQAAQFVASGAADAGIVAYALVLGAGLGRPGRWTLVDDALHAPLWQAFMVTARAADDPRAHAFAGFVEGEAGRAVLARYGFALPE
jgi:molybdate transport system substrate-binding protein